MPKTDQLPDNSPTSTIYHLELTDREQELIAQLTLIRNNLHLALAKVASLQTDCALLTEQSRRQSAILLELYRVRTYLLAKVAKERRKRERMEQSIWRRIATPLRKPNKIGRRTDHDEKTGLLSSSTGPSTGSSQDLPTGPMSRSPDVQSPAAWVPLANAGPPTNSDLQVIAVYASGQNEHPLNREVSGIAAGEAADLTNRNLCPPSRPPHRSSGNLTKSRLHRHVQLAQQYGITGFCFPYFEEQQHRSDTVLERYAEDLSLGLDYCIHWWNETGKVAAVRSHLDWTRETCSADSNEISFVTRVAHHFRDQRYLRIDGRAVLIVSRPDLLTNPVATVSHWRIWCEDNSLGKLFLLYRNPSTRSNVYQHLFDGVVDFRCCDCARINADSPEEGEQSRPTDCVRQPMSRNELDESSCKSEQVVLQCAGPGCLLLGHDAICEPQRSQSPHDFRLALEAASQRATRHVGAPGMVFIGPWSSSCGHPRLEPDLVKGYAYLEATRQGLRCSSVGRMRSSRGCRLAVILHIFYIDVFMETIPLLKRLSIPHDIFATCPPSLHDEVDALLGTLGGATILLEAVENRGRDVAPFLFMMAAVDANEYDVVLKLHTKKSPHHPDGGSWSEDILGKLLDQERARAAVAELRSGRGFGILGPEGSVVSMDYYGGINIERVLKLAGMMGFIPLPGSADVFVAGTMFYARVDALRPLLEIGLTFGDFEPETGQTDGALAHVIERAVSYSALVAGYRVGELALTRDGMIARVPDIGQARLSLVDHL